MQTQREYLIGLGLAKPGRGKFSNAGREALAAARAKGVAFSDVAAKVKATADKAAPVAAPVRAEPSDPLNTPYLTPDEYRFPESEYRATVSEGGKSREVSLRECCNTCRVSLVNHACEHPSILDGLAVKIVRR